MSPAQIRSPQIEPLMFSILVAVAASSDDIERSLNVGGEPPGLLLERGGSFS
jgi:hypothetical protein